MGTGGMGQRLVKFVGVKVMEVKEFVEHNSGDTDLCITYNATLC